MKLYLWMHAGQTQHSTAEALELVGIQIHEADLIFNKTTFCCEKY